MLQLTPDGRQDGVAAWASQVDACCPTPICYNPTQVSCQLIASLPSGPMWDAQKDMAMSRITDNSCPPFGWLCEPLNPCAPKQTCTTLADYAVYLAQYLAVVAGGSLWRSRQESSPFTAVETAVQWLDRLGWVDCFDGLCATPSSSNGMEPDCGPACHVPPPEELRCAVNRGLLSALSRAQLSPVPNIDGLNYILEPLGVYVVPELRDTLPEWCRPSDFCGVVYHLRHVDGLIEACFQTECYEYRPPSRIPASFVATCRETRGSPRTFYPALAAAYCLARSFLPTCPDVIIPEFDLIN